MIIFTESGRNSQKNVTSLLPVPFVFFEVPESGSECVPSNDVVTQIKALEVYGW